MPFHFLHSRLSDAPLHIPEIGLKLHVRMEPSDSDGSMSIIETENAPGFGPPLHRHRETEIFRVLEGRYLYEIDGKRFTAETGDVVTIPGGAVHAFRNEASTPSRQLIMIVPGLDAAAFFSGLAETMKGGKLDPESLNAFSRKWQIEFLGPPL
ncbi:cupin domain-containing protein [Ruegeria sediminis]|uniref:Cupin domain-containing protein n=1 Tax=Ruegeria sediminis TaxID=2583820 RepID=A0ABY2WZ29_9RHOB|nr:cupin domain-containing protein [Ruegeria sediminis]TMV07846.1 cupin domain-containing protein [Ruegeria sediminis]